jgi:CO/xanthine dehydrogenase FAD-binding subunit
MIPPFDYSIAKTMKEACDLLWEFREEVKIIAGGTDLLSGLRNGDLKPRSLIDITRIEELRKIEEQDGMIWIGGAVTHHEIASSSLVKRYGRVLAEAASWIGSPQIRNLGTVGGNIINASPAADTVPPLIAMNAAVRVVSREGEREIPLDRLFRRPYESNLKPHEILAQVKFAKLSSSARSSYIRLARRGAMAIARMSVAVVLRSEKGRMEDVRISVGSVTPTPQRMSEAESVLEGRSPDEKGLRLAAHQISERMIRQSGVRPSTSYKKPVVEALFIRAMRRALEGLI